MPSKNVFAEFGFTVEDATIEAWRSDLARIVRQRFERSQQSQVAFANQLGIKQSVVSRVINGRLRGLSVEFLLRLCVRLETRGVGRWGPSAEEAVVTTEVAIATGTETIYATVRDLPLSPLDEVRATVARSRALNPSSTTRVEH